IPPRRGSFTDFNYGNTIPFRSAATAKTKDRHRSQELAGALSFNVEADRYRTHHKRKALADRQSESAKVHLCALRRRSYLDKTRRGARSPASISIWDASCTRALA